MNNRLMVESFLFDVVVDAALQALSRRRSDDGDEGVRGPADDSEAARRVGEQLVRDAMARGLRGVDTAQSLAPFAGGNTAMVVGALETRLGFVLKVQSDDKVVTEARLLEQIRDDVRLPARFRQAVPEVYAVADEGPPYGYLMEHLEGYTPVHELLLDPTRKQDGLLALRDAWGVLREVYAATLDKRLLPNTRADYVDRVLPRVDQAVAVRSELALDRPLTVVRDGQATDLPAPQELLERAAAYADGLRPPFSAVVHGDPNPENLLVGRIESAAEIRIIDLKDWWRGDWVFDLAKIGHYLLVTAAVENGQAGTPSIDANGGHARIAYDLTPAPALIAAERHLRDDSHSFADRHGDPKWEERYRLGVASNLLGVAGPRLQQGAEGNRVQDEMGLIAWAEGMRLLAHALAGE
jgi:hypothetical protein